MLEHDSEDLEHCLLPILSTLRQLLSPENDGTKIEITTNKISKLINKLVLCCHDNNVSPSNADRATKLLLEIIVLVCFIIIYHFILFLKN